MQRGEPFIISRYSLVVVSGEEKKTPCYLTNLDLKSENMGVGAGTRGKIEDT